MATTIESKRIEFETGNKYIRGEISTSIGLKTGNGFRVYVYVHLWRTNAYDGNSYGHISYELKFNGEVLDSDVNKSFTVYPGGKPYLVASFSKDVSPSSGYPTSSYSYTVSFKSTGDIEAFNTKNEVKLSHTITPFATKVVAPKISLMNNYDGTVTIDREPKVSGDSKYKGDNSTATDCHCYYKWCTNESDAWPTLSNSGSDGSFNNKTNSWTVTIPTDEPKYYLKVVACTIGTVDGTDGVKMANSDVVYDSIEVHPVPIPGWANDATLELLSTNDDAPTIEASFIAKWSGGITRIADTVGDIDGYLLKAQIKDKDDIYIGKISKDDPGECVVNDDEWSLNISNVLGEHDIKLSLGDELVFMVSPYINYGNRMLFDDYKTIGIFPESAARIYLYYDEESNFRLGIPYVCLGKGVWKEATNIYIRKSDKLNDWVQPSQEVVEL